MAPEPNNDNVQEEQPLYKNFRKFVLVTTISLVALFVLMYLTMHFTSQANFCTNCHEIRQPVATWTLGTHNHVACLDCHANPGTVGYIERKFKGLGEVYLHFTNQIPTTIVARYNLQTCIVCHTGQNRHYPKAKNIKLPPGEPLAPIVSHTEILQNNTSCLVCHRNVGHVLAPTVSTINTFISQRITVSGH